MTTPPVTARLNAEGSSFEKPEPNIINGPNPGAANPNDTGFLPAVGGHLRLEAMESTLTDADRSVPFTRQFQACMEITDYGNHHRLPRVKPCRTNVERCRLDKRIGQSLRRSRCDLAAKRKQPRRDSPNQPELPIFPDLPVQAFVAKRADKLTQQRMIAEEPEWECGT